MPLFVERYANAAVTTLSGSITSGSLTLNVAATPPGLESPQFRVGIDAEWLLVNGVTGTTWAVQRAIEGSIAAAHASGSALTHLLTASGLVGVCGSTVLSGPVASLPVTGVVGREYFSSDGPYLYREGTTGWAAWAPLWPVTVAPATGSWSWTNQGGATLTQNGGVLRLNAPGNSAADNFRITSMAAPATGYTITALVVPEVHNTGFNNCGIGWRDSNTGAIAFISILAGGTAAYSICSRHAAGATSSQTVYLDQTGFALQSPIWLQIQDDGVNRYVRYSYNGSDFVLLDTQTRTTTVEPNQVMIFAESLSTSYYCAINILSWTVTHP